MKAALILAGGAGTRLWPLSTEERPKQFLRLFGGKSLLRLTYERLVQLVPADSIWIATNHRYRGAVLEELPELPPDRVLLEPARRNTAPAIAVCCAVIHAQLPEAVVGIFPSDHAIADEKTFLARASAAYEMAAEGEALVTIGIQPSEPNVGYGYLEIGEPAADGFRVRRFVEKPDAETAALYVKSGQFLWNAGMFLWKLSTFFDVLAGTEPSIADLTEQWLVAESPERDAIYEAMPSISIDYAVMEKAPNVATVPGSFGWSDVGSWKALTAHSSGNTEGVWRLRSDGAWTHVANDIPVAIVGLPHVAVVQTPRGLLVLNLDDDAGLSDLVKKIEMEVSRTAG